MRRVHPRHPVLVLDNLRRRLLKNTPYEKHRLLLIASEHILKKLDFRFNVSRHVLEELDLQGELASIGLSIQEIQASWLPDVLRVRDFYIDSARTTENEDHFQIPLEFLIMLDAAAGDGNSQVGLELLDISNDMFCHSWSDLTGDEQAKDEERASTEYLHTCLWILVQDFDSAHEHIERAIQRYLVQRVEFRCEVYYKGREWLLRGCMAEALDGKGCHDMAERYYREALSLRPPYNKYSEYEVGLGRCMLLQGKINEAKWHLASFLLDLERAPSGLGNAHLDDGDSRATAFDFHRRAFQSLRLSLGAEHPMFGTASYKLGVHYYTRAITGSSDVEVDLKTALYVYMSPAAVVTEDMLTQTQI
ncbi:hypothetical protein N7517_000374 [Penicillium concentricum]|uniref:Uncharacterized protein n=1 Tax=Penicillium concentricum TaxID=293559 RepID=A0A9W9VHJ3_9EURO|nr:uncharacterized protein N7517_000374 [Penicillium concentricum]KAJ5382463.1 hypothetical protein N7517_000374 [Penicillium concentricum]